MSLMSTVVVTGQVRGLRFWCPGCQKEHFLAVEAPDPNGRVWVLSGGLDTPDIDKSIETKCYDVSGTPAGVCFCAVTGGKLIYGTSSTHQLAGSTVPMVPSPQQ